MGVDHISPIDDLICAALRGENSAWPEESDDAFVAAFLARSAYHGVQALLHHHFSTGQSRAQGWPDLVLEACRNATLGQAMWEIRHQLLLGEALEHLTGIGIRPILFKGTALAFGVYPSPFLRTRGDTDLIIPSHLRDQACRVLESLGFESTLGERGDLVAFTADCSRNDPATGVHELDLHWRISNAQALSKLFSYEELLAEAEPLPALSPDAIAASNTHALLIACMHRAGHRQCPYFVENVEYYGLARVLEASNLQRGPSWLRLLFGGQ